MLFGHGDDFYNTKNQVRINFSSNVWYGADLNKLKEYLTETFDVLTRYPEPDAGSLKRLIASRLEVTEESLLVTNGSVSAFYLLAQAWKGAKSTILYPAFSEYEEACRLYEHEMRFFSTSDDLSTLPLDGQDLCWICNPNNPDGRLYSRDELLELIKANGKTTFVIDQAYTAFTTREVLTPADMRSCENLILIQSISKAYKTPGIRIGYIIARPGVIQELNKYVIPWSVNAFAVEAGKYILTHPNQFVLPLRQWQEDTVDFIGELNRLGEVEALPTATTFFLVKLKKGLAADLKTYLLEQEGILIRDASNFRGLDETYIRLSTQTPQENREFVGLLREWLRKQ